MPKIKKSHQITPTGVTWLLVAVVALQFLCALVYGRVYSFFSFERPNGYLLRICLHLFAVLLPAGLYLYPKNIDTTETFLVRRLDGKNILLLAGLGVCAQYLGRILNSLMVFVLDQCGADLPVSTLEVPRNVGMFLLALLAVVLLPAITEELLMRGVVLHAYLWRGNKSAIVMTALMFGLIHLDVRNLFSTVLLGVLLAAVVLRTGSIWAGMILHGVNNLLVLLGFVIEHALTPFWADLIVYLLFGLALIGIMPLWRMFRLHNLKNEGRMEIPMKKSVPYDLGRLIFSLPGILLIVAFVLFQVFLFSGV